jgi:cytochrome c
MFRALPVLILLSCPALAQDAALGETVFKKCSACHAIIAADGTEVRKGGKVGPNLFGVIGRRIGSYPDFNYGGALVAAGAEGAVWDGQSLALYVQNPSAWLQEKTGDAGARSKMSFKLGKGGADVAAYLAALAP